MRYAGNDWFDGLAISDLRPDDPEKNAYPVISLSLKDAYTSTYEEFEISMGIRMSDLYLKFPEIAECSSVPASLRKRYEDVIERRAAAPLLKNALGDLSDMLEMVHGRKTIILIDEYDRPLNSSYGEPFQHSIVVFVRDMLSRALKGSRSLRFAVVTGIMQIAKESIFSGLNNLRVNNILSTDMDEMFGFTSKEVEGMCREFGHPEKFTEAKEWYDGYRFGDADIYNPWSVLNYVGNGFVPGPYWAGTSGNSIIDDLIRMPDTGTYSRLLTLGAGGTIASDITPRVTFADIGDADRGIYSVLAFTGYLTAIRDSAGYSLRIPNREMYGVYADMIVDRLGKDGMMSSMRGLAEAILSGKTDRIAETLRDLLENAVSARILDSEHAYQAFIVGLLMNLFGNYDITADFESGDGYHDIRLKRIRGDGPNVVIELKRAKPNLPDDDLRTVAADALEQIRKMDYTHGLRGKTLMYGIAFSGKRPAIASDTVEM